MLSKRIWDDNPSTGGYDFRGIAAASRENGIVYILTGYFNTDMYTGFEWRLYKSRANDIANMDMMILSDAVSSGILESIDHDTAIVPSLSQRSRIFFWDMLYENALTVDEERLWFLMGTPLLITLANAYASQRVPGSYRYYPAGTGTGAIGQGSVENGGENVNSADLTIETLKQAALMRSLKRSFTAPKVTSRSVSISFDEAEEEEK